MKLLVLALLLKICAGTHRPDYDGQYGSLERLLREIEEDLPPAPTQQGHEGHPKDLRSLYEGFEKRDAMPIAPTIERRAAPLSTRVQLALARRNTLMSRRAVGGADQQAILDKHNALRAQEGASNMVKMGWHDGSAKLAQTWADELAKGCKVEHDSQEAHTSAPFQACGQNVAKGQKNWEGAVQSWYDEKSMFTYGGAHNPETGHYTQVVWDESALVGCGIAKCSSGTPIYVCNYCPAGNYMSRITQPYKKGAACSECPSGCADGKLCNPSNCQKQNEWTNCDELASAHGKAAICGSVAANCARLCEC